MIVDLTSATGTQKIWKQERFVLYGHGQDYTAPLKIWTNLHGSSSSPLATYSPHDTDKVYVDMSDYVRAYTTLQTIYALTSQMQGALVLGVQVVGLISPDNVIIPPCWPYAKIVPPNYIIAGASGQVIAEFYDYTADTYTLGGVSGSASFANSNRNIIINDAFKLIRTGSQLRFKDYAPRAQECGKLYALVDWVSFSGAQRRHIFEVVKNKISAINAYSLRNINNEYTEVKGREDGLTLCLLGLNTYDFWYYSDVLTSSKVRLSLDGTNYTQVQVTTKSATIPDGENNDGKLEINVNWKRYDAVAM